MKQTKYSGQVNEKAREWFVTMQSDDIDPEKNCQFLDWIMQDPAHQQAYNDYQRIFADVASLGQGANGTSLLAYPAQKSTSWLKDLSAKLVNYINPPIAIIALASISLFVLAFLLRAHEDIKFYNYQTAVAEIATIKLEDGSEITLSGKTSLKAWFNSNERHVELLNGQAFFNIAKNPKKPFWINIDHTLVKVVGTQFDIHKTDNTVMVAVSEGIVSIFNINEQNKDNYANLNSSQSVKLVKNQRITNSRLHGLGDVEKITANDVATWRLGKLYFKYEKLKDVVEDINRYYNGTIECDPKIADMPLTAVISIDKISTITEVLAALLPIKIEDGENNHIVLRPK